MALSSTNNRISYSGNGVTTAFAFPYKFLTDADLVVIERVTATGVETVKTLTTHYTVVGETLDAGGTVTMLTAPASGVQLIIYRDVAATQELDYRENDSFPAESTESGFDKLTMITQRLKDVSERAVTLSEGYTAAFDTTLPPVLTAGSSLIINADGDGFDVGPTVVSIEEHNMDTTDVHGIPDTSVLVTLAGSQTLTNKTIDGDDNTVQDISLSSLKTVGGDASKFLARDGSGAVVSTNTVPAGTVVGTSDSQTLTNKTLTSPTLTTPAIDVATLDGQASTPSSPSSGFYKAYVKDSTQKLTILNSSGVETTVGSGGVGQNFISNGDAEAGTTDWATYADAAASSPVDGTGGSPNVTLTASSTDPLSGNQSFILTKDAANRQGQGASINFTIDNAAKTKVLTVKFDYICGSGFTAGSSTVDSDVTVWIYDVTNSVLIQPSNFRLFSNSVTVPEQFQAEFQASSNSTSYRLILHVATTSAVAWNIKLDSFIVSPNEYVFGSPVGNPVSYGAMTITGTSVNPTKATTRENDSVTVTKFGKFAKVTYRYYASSAAGAAAGTGTYLWALPGGLAMDTTLQPNTAGNTTSATSHLVCHIPGSFKARSDTGPSGAFEYKIVATSATQFYVYYQQLGATGNGNVGSGAFPLSQIIGFTIDIWVPIAGWESSVQMADQTSTRLVDVHAVMTSNQAITANTTNIPFVVDTTLGCRDSHGAWSGSVFTVPVPGDYWIFTNLLTTSSAASISVYKNASLFRRASGADASAWKAGGILLANLVVGDAISLRGDTSLTLTGAANGQVASSISIMRVSGPSQIASSETVAASAYCSANFAAGTTTPINFDTKEFDTHGAIAPSATVWKFTAPISGAYAVSGSVQSSGSGFLLLYKNGTVYKSATGWTAATAVGAYSLILFLNAGDYIDMRPGGAITATGGSLSGNGVSNINIQRIGNRG